MHKHKLRACVVGHIHVFQMTRDNKAPTHKTDKRLYLCSVVLYKTAIVHWNTWWFWLCPNPQTFCPKSEAQLELAHIESWCMVKKLCQRCPSGKLFLVGLQSAYTCFSFQLILLAKPSRWKTWCKHFFLKTLSSKKHWIRVQRHFVKHESKTE